MIYHIYLSASMMKNNNLSLCWSNITNVSLHQCSKCISIARLHMSQLQIRKHTIHNAIILSTLLRYFLCYHVLINAKWLKLAVFPNDMCNYVYLMIYQFRLNDTYFCMILHRLLASRHDANKQDFEMKLNLSWKITFNQPKNNRDLKKNVLHLLFQIRPF